MTTERQRQQELAIKSGQPKLYEYRCANGEGFEAVAATERSAFRVLNAERPGMYGECLRVRPAHQVDMRIYPPFVRAARTQCQRLGAFEAEDTYIPPVLRA